MVLDWHEFPDAPARGTFLCALVDIPAGGVLSGALGDFPFLVMLVDGAPRVFVNACPHQFLPLDQRGGQVLSVDGKHLLCSNHSAKFRADDGFGVAGEGIGCRLSLIPTVMTDQAIYVAT